MARRSKASSSATKTRDDQRLIGLCLRWTGGRFCRRWGDGGYRTAVADVGVCPGRRVLASRRMSATTHFSPMTAPLMIPTSSMSRKADACDCASSTARRLRVSSSRRLGSQARSAPFLFWLRSKMHRPRPASCLRQLVPRSPSGQRSAVRRLACSIDLPAIGSNGSDVRERLHGVEWETVRYHRSVACLFGRGRTWATCPVARRRIY